MTHYVSILDGKDDVWGIIIPDFPGCHGGGLTVNGAIADATSCLREFASDMVANGEPLPAPRPPDAIRADTEFAFAFKQAHTLVMIPLILDCGRSVRANLSLDAGLLEAIDAAAKQAGVTRSTFMATAAKEKMGVA